MQPAVASLVQAIANNNGRIIPTSYMTFMSDDMIAFCALYNSVTSGFDLAEYNVYVTMISQEIHQLRNPVPFNFLDLTPDLIDTGYNLSYDSTTVPQDYELHQQFFEFLQSTSSTTTDYTSYDEWLEDLTTEGIEPNPGPSDLHYHTDTEDQPLLAPLPPAFNFPPPPALGFWQQIVAPTANMNLLQLIAYFSILPFCILYSLITISITTYTRFRPTLAPPPLLVLFVQFILNPLLAHYLAKALIQMLLLMAGIESNPGPQSESAHPREASDTQSVASSFEDKFPISRSQEKRNSKFSHAYLSSLLETQKREKKLTRLRQFQRAHKSTQWDDEFSSIPFVAHNNRRLEKFLTSKDSLQPNGISSIFKKMTVFCCKPRDDEIYDFLTVSCRLDPMIALALTPVIKAIKRILLNKITVGIALTVLAYYVARLIDIPVLLFTPIITLILAYIIKDVSASVVDAFTNLYQAFSNAYTKLNKFVERQDEVIIKWDDFDRIDGPSVLKCLQLYNDDKQWQSAFIKYSMTHDFESETDKEFAYNVPSEVATFLHRMDIIKEDDPFIASTLLKPNSFTDLCQNFSSGVQSLFASLGLISATFSLPSAVYFYSSSKRFISQIYSMFQDIYPTVYEFITGKKYISPEVAKYLNIFGEISTKIHLTLKTARQSNIIDEDPAFRLRITDQYEELLDAQLKLLSLKAPPTYMVPLNNLLRELSVLANSCYGRTKGESERPEPVLVFIRGPPDVGKTTICQALALIISQRLSLTCNLNADFFIRECGSEFWEGYARQRFCRLDDAFQDTTPEKVVQTIMEVIRMKNSCPYKLNMADLQSKVATFFNSDFVFINTNIDNVTSEFIADIGAFYRRIDFDVVVLAKPPIGDNGEITVDYNMTVNKEPCTVARLADSMVALYKKKNTLDKSVSAAIRDLVTKIPATATSDLIAARNSKTDFCGQVQSDKYNQDPNNVTLHRAPTPDTKTTRNKGLFKRQGSGRGGRINTDIRANGTITDYFSTHIQSASTYISTKFTKALPTQRTIESSLLACTAALSSCSAAKLLAAAFLTWMAACGVAYGTYTLISQLCKQIAQTIFPNSRKVKDQLTGDKTTKVTNTPQTIKAQLKATQAAIDKVSAKKLLSKIKPNSSSTRWSQAMISYIQDIGWTHSQWVADSLASIEVMEEANLTTAERDDLKRLQENIVSHRTFYTRDDTTYVLEAKALILNQDHLIVPSHQLPLTHPIVNMEVKIANKWINVKNCKIIRIENSDTCIVVLSTYLPCRDISYMFNPLSQISATDSDVFLLRNFDDVMTICPCPDFRSVDRVISYQTDFNEIITCGTIFESHTAVCPGDSGCFYVSLKHGRVQIIGMHIASGSSAAHGRFISKEMIAPFSSKARLAPTPYDSVSGPLKPNSFDHALARNSNCIPIGVVEPRTMISSRSKIARSDLYGCEQLPPVTEFPVNLKRSFDNSDILAKANAKFRLRDEPDVSPALCEEIIHALLDEHPNVKGTTFYTNTEAVEGADNMPHITMTTSSGFPYSATGKTPKTKLTDLDWIDIFKIVDHMLEDLYNNLPPQAIFQTSFKDEIRTWLKVHYPRVINCASVALTLLFRRVLGPWMNMVHSSYSKIRTKVGINAHDVDWKILYDTLCAISPNNIIELDYSGYEYNHPQFGFILASEMIYRLYIRSGFSEKDAAAARLLIRSCCGGFVIQNEVLIYIWMLLSGLPITAELNSLLNEIYQMFAYKKLTNLALVTMREKVASAFYGDDLLHSVSDDLKDVFNALTVQKFCAEVLSMKVTPAANKTGSLPAFVTILECSFLCRKFAPRENRVDAPLNIDTSTNSLQYYVPVAHMSQKELISAKCRSFLTELTHYPPEVYKHWADILSFLKAKHNLDFICYDYPAALSRRVQMPHLD
jgi:hypothetical protein